MAEASLVFVAPHYDDVALSCGGQVAFAARGSTPLIATVFAAAPRGGLGAFAAFQHERWGFAATHAVAARRAEDACAADALGGAVRTAWLDELDAIYRDPAYDSDAALFGRVLDGDVPVVARVADSLAALLGPHPASVCYVPLGVGDHVDHQLAFRAGQMLAGRGRAVWAYADIPYALDAAVLVRRLARGGVAERRVVALDADAWRRKLAAIDCYASQLPVIFRDHGAPRAALEAQARVIGGGALAEAVWRVIDGADPWSVVQPRR